MAFGIPAVSADSSSVTSSVPSTPDLINSPSVSFASVSLPPTPELASEATFVDPYKGTFLDDAWSRSIPMHAYLAKHADDDDEEAALVSLQKQAEHDHGIATLKGLVHRSILQVLDEASSLDGYAFSAPSEAPATTFGFEAELDDASPKPFFESRSASVGGLKKSPTMHNVRQDLDSNSEEDDEAFSDSDEDDY